MHRKILATWSELGIRQPIMSAPGEDPVKKARSEFSVTKELLSRAVDSKTIPECPKRFKFYIGIKGLSLVLQSGEIVDDELFSILKEEFLHSLQVIKAGL